MKDHGHGNKCHSTPSRGQRERIGVRKVDARSVPYGVNVSRNGATCWAAFDGERLVCVAATAEQARMKYRALKAQRVTVKKS